MRGVRTRGETSRRRPHTVSRCRRGSVNMVIVIIRIKYLCGQVQIQVEQRDAGHDQVACT